MNRLPLWVPGPQPCRGPLIASADRCWADGRTECGALVCFCVCHLGSEKADWPAGAAVCRAGGGGARRAVNSGEGQGRGPCESRLNPFPAEPDGPASEERLRHWPPHSCLTCRLPGPARQSRGSPVRGRRMSAGLGKERLPLAVCGQGFGHWAAPQLP